MAEFKKAGGNWVSELDRVWSFGPRRVGPNILLNHIQGININQKIAISR